MAGVSPSALPPWSAGSAGGGDFGAGRGLAPDRCLAPAAGQPLDGQAGPGAEPPPLMGGADRPARLLTGGGAPGGAPGPAPPLAPGAGPAPAPPPPPPGPPA